MKEPGLELPDTSQDLLLASLDEITLLQMLFSFH
jgi:hypothetical protein